jgi:hypothetical protein
MTGLLLENIKLVLLFALIATVITLSRVGQSVPEARKSHHRSAPAGR